MSKYPFDKNGGGSVLIVGELVYGLMFSLDLDCVFLKRDILNNIFLLGL